MQTVIAVDIHGAKLIHLEMSATKAHALLKKDGRAARGEAHQQGSHKQDGRKYSDGKQGKSAIQATLCQEIAGAALGSRYRTPGRERLFALARQCRGFVEFSQVWQYFWPTGGVCV